MIAGIGLTRVQGYIDGVLSGDIVTGEAVRGAVQRHVDDLARQGSKDFPYHFSANVAEAAIEFYPSLLRHSIGEFAGLPFELEPWQQFAVANIYGWKRDDDETRRFRKAYLSMARKNGKSSWGAGMAVFAAMMDYNPKTGTPEPVAEVVLAASKREQSEKVIYAEIERMRLQSPYIKQASKLAHKQFTFMANSGTIRCVGSDKPYDGLNPHVIVLDELHAWREFHRGFYDTMMTGGGSRAQPLTVIITTAGSDTSYIWMDEWKYAVGVATGRITDDAVFGLSYEMDEADDVLDPKNWPKSNPNLGVSVKVGYLEQQAAQAEESSASLNRFTRYHANRIVSSTNAAFDMAQWDDCPLNEMDWNEADAIGGGIDLGGRDDLCAWALVARFPTGEVNEDELPIWRYECRVKSYIADDTTRDLTQEPFAQWVYSDLLTVCKYPVGDLRADLIQQAYDLHVTDIAYDPYGGQLVAEDLAREGMQIASMAQNTSHFTEPIRELMQAIAEGRFAHDGNPLLRWCVKNAVLVTDTNERCMFSKRDSSGKIDPVVALTMAFRRAMLAPTRADSYYSM